MSQTNLDDDELFGEAANEMRSDVEASLAEARGALPEADAVWDVEADNTLGVLNASDVEASLAEARGALPEADAVWDVEADNTLGVLNALKTALDVGDAEDHLRDAKKWYTMGERADAFEDADDLAEEIETVAGLIEDVEDARGQVGDLTATIPQLRSTLEESEDAPDTLRSTLEEFEDAPDTEADADAEEAEA